MYDVALRAVRDALSAEHLALCDEARIAWGLSAARVGWGPKPLGGNPNPKPPTRFQGEGEGIPRSYLDLKFSEKIC